MLFVSQIHFTFTFSKSLGKLFIALFLFWHVYLQNRKAWVLSFDLPLLPQQSASVSVYFWQLSIQLKLLRQKEHVTPGRYGRFELCLFTLLDLSSLLVTMPGIIDRITTKFYENNCSQFQGKTNLSLKVLQIFEWHLKPDLFQIIIRILKLLFQSKGIQVSIWNRNNDIQKYSVAFQNATVYTWRSGPDICSLICGFCVHVFCIKIQMGSFLPLDVEKHFIS